MLNYITRTVYVVLIIFIFSCSTDETIPKEETLITYNLTMNVLPEDSGSISTNAEVYEEGEEVSLEAIPVDEFTFKEWEGGVEGQDNPIKFTMDSDKTITAVFEKVTYSLGIDILGKWSITTSRSQEKTSTTNECSLISIEFQEDGVFIIIKTEGEIRGTYTVSGNNSLDLGIGTIANLDLSEEGVLSFVINLGDSCSSALSGLPMTYLPDDIFEQELINQGYDDILDDYVITNNINAIKTLSVERFNSHNEQISDLTGIQDFKDLINLDASYNQLTDLDVSHNLALTSLRLSKNQLTSLDISKNSFLTSLSLESNQLSGLDIGANTSLTSLYLSSNQLTTLDISKNTELENLYLVDNQLTTLDISNNNNLISLNISTNRGFLNLDVSNNPILENLWWDNNIKLKCIQVNTDQLNNIPSGWIDVGQDMIFALDCDNPNGKTYVPDDNFEQALIDLGYDDILDDYVVTENIETIQFFEYDGADKPIDLKIIDLTGIKDFSALKSLILPYNEISSIDLTTNIVLMDLILTGNNLSSINLSNNVNLNHFRLNENELREFRISDLNRLDFFTLSDNPLTTVDLENIKVLEFDINSSTIDILNLKNVTVGEVHILENDLTTINFENTSIGHLNLRGNRDLKIDFSGLKDVWLLSIRDMQLSAIDINGLSELLYLDILNTDLTTIDLSSNTLLIRLDIRTNIFSNLDVSMLNALEYVEATNNNLSCIKINNSQLESVNWKVDEGVNLSEECN